MAGRHFKDQTVVLDGKKFNHDTFTRCTLVYKGAKPPELIGCTFKDTGFIFDGAAGQTLAVMRHLYHGGFRAVIENTIKNIRTPPSPHDDTVH
jgi:hypothetical protein